MEQSLTWALFSASVNIWGENLNSAVVERLNKGFMSARSPTGHLAHPARVVAWHSRPGTPGQHHAWHTQILHRAWHTRHTWRMHYTGAYITQVDETCPQSGRCTTPKGIPG
eukprot:8886483-Pyramimonas_sp.AAC.2